MQRARVLTEALQLVRDRQRVLRRCAWCGRVWLGGTWVDDEEVPRFLPSDLDVHSTHSICPSCLARFESKSG
jgi:hypothetical protein